jgi:hypothetical protein
MDREEERARRRTQRERERGKWSPLTNSSLVLLHVECMSNSRAQAVSSAERMVFGGSPGWPHGSFLGGIGPDNTCSHHSLRPTLFLASAWSSTSICVSQMQTQIDVQEQCEPPSFFGHKRYVPFGQSQELRFRTSPGAVVRTSGDILTRSCWIHSMSVKYLQHVVIREDKYLGAVILDEVSFQKITRCGGA